MALPLLALSAASTLLSAYGKYSQAKEEQETLDYNKRILQANEKMNQASIAFDKMRAKRESERFISAQRVAISGSGVTLGGSALDVMLDSLKEIELDMFTFELESMKSKLRASSGISNIDNQINTSKKALPISLASTAVSGYSQYASSRGGTN